MPVLCTPRRYVGEQPSKTNSTIERADLRGSVMSSGVDAFEIVADFGTVVLPTQPTCLIVEDQALISLALEAYLENSGIGPCEVFSSSGDALAWLASHTPTVAILDFGLRDGPCIPLIRVLRQRSIPFVVYSGHKREVALPDLQDVPWLSKPCDRAALLAALTRTMPVLALQSISDAA